MYVSKVVLALETRIVKRASKYYCYIYTEDLTQNNNVDCNGSLGVKI